MDVMIASVYFPGLFIICLGSIWFFYGIYQMETDDYYLSLPPLYQDAKKPVQDRVEDLLARMTLSEKIGQMVQIDNNMATSALMQYYGIGSVLTAGVEAKRGKLAPPDGSVQAWIRRINSLQNASLSSRLRIPYIYGIDAIHGHNYVYGATIFPHNIGLGATRDPNLVKRIGAATAREVRATGIPYVFAPCVAVCRDPRWGRCYESYSEDHNVVEEMTDIILGLQGEIPSGSPKGVPYVGGKNKVAACAKHFIGDESTRGTNEKRKSTLFDTLQLLTLHMPAFTKSIVKGVSTIMVSYGSWDGEKMHANHVLITDFLKNELKFKGFVISNWKGIDRITSPADANCTYSVLVSIQAGIDMVMVDFNPFHFIDALTYLVRNKFIPMDRIDDAVRRILLVKFTTGLFEEPYADLNLVNELGSKVHRDLAREAVRRSLVLLKNGKNGTNPLLPLPKEASKILVAGTHADNLGYQCGGWTINWQGFDGNNSTRGTTILAAVRSAVHRKTQVVYQENPVGDFVKSNNFDFAIVVVGEPPYAETAGDSADLTMMYPAASIINNVCGDLKCVVIIISGRPVLMEPYLPAIDSLVAAWLPGSEGQGVTDVLFGDYEFNGTLPITWFRTVDQLPMNVGDSHYDPLFHLGFGLKMKSKVDNPFSELLCCICSVICLLAPIPKAWKMVKKHFVSLESDPPIGVYLVWLVSYGHYLMYCNEVGDWMSAIVAIFGLLAYFLCSVPYVLFHEPLKRVIGFCTIGVLSISLATQLGDNIKILSMTYGAAAYVVAFSAYWLRDRENVELWDLYFTWGTAVSDMLWTIYSYYEQDNYMYVYGLGASLEILEAVLTLIKYIEMRWRIERQRERERELAQQRERQRDRLFRSMSRLE